MPLVVLKPVWGGESSHKLTIDELPSHTHTRGTMNIVGTRQFAAGGYGIENSTSTGAFYNPDYYNGGKGGYIGSGGTGTLIRNLTFDASRNWTGETSSVGNSKSHNNMPPYLTAYCWKRTS